ncbi:MAG: hypothetical protein WCH86_01855 [Kiritimatiellales bacterium]
MKKIVITGLALLLACSASAWQHMYTFPENQFDDIVFNGTSYLCLQGLSASATSTDLQTWSVHTNLSFPPSLYDIGDPESSVSIDSRDITAIDHKFFIVLHRLTHIGAMGNMYSDENISLTSTNGVDWNDPCIFGWGGASSGLASFPSFVLSAVLEIDRSGWQQIGAPGYFNFYVYDPSSNQWTRTLSSAVWPDEQQRLFQDEQDAFFSFTAYTNGFPRQILCTSNGVDYRVIAGGPGNAEPAAAHAGQILCESQIYTPGKGWEASPFPDLRAAKFNGNRLVGCRESSLVYSDDFGVTWDTTTIPNLISVKIIEAEGQYVALLSMQSGEGAYTSIYSISASPARAAVSEIGNITAENQQLSIPSVSNALYQVESSTNLITASWQSYGLPVMGTGTNLVVPLLSSSNSAMFFKIKAVNP